jgi:ketosteroid isomerase-like protein
MKKIILITFILFSNRINAQNRDELSIIQILKTQEKAWNNGNLDAFMIGYWNNDSLMFIGKRGLTYGYNATLANYKKSYPDTAYMGKFSSTLISIKRLSNEYYFVIGKWELTRTVGNISGHYSLLFRKIKGKWVVVADHSS